MFVGRRKRKFYMKKFMCLLCMCFMICFNVVFVYSNTIYPNTDLTRIEFEMDGEPIIYSNYPETIYNGQPMQPELNINQIGMSMGKFYGVGKYLNKVDINKDKKYSAELYNGRSPGIAEDYIFAMAFIFDGKDDETANITIYKAGQQNSVRVNSILRMSLDTQFNYYNSDIYKNYSNLGKEYSKPRVINLSGKDAKIVIFEEIGNISGYANCRIQFSSDKDVRLVQFYALKSTLSEDLSSLGFGEVNQDNFDKANLYNRIAEISQDENKVKKLEEFPHYWTTTTAVLNYDKRKASFDAPVGTKFCLSNAGHLKGTGKVGIRDLNINEYEYLSDEDYGGFPFNEERIHDGNYSIEYDIELKGAEGKKLKIIPYKEEGKSISSGVILYNSIYDMWYYPEPNADYWVMPIPKGGKFKFVLPGSVYGDIQFEVLEGSDNYSIVLDDSYDSWAEKSLAEALYSGLVPYDLQKNYKNKMTRQEFCSIALKLFLNRKGKTFDEFIEDNGIVFNDNVFTDTRNRYTLLAYNLGIIKGMGNNKFAPNDFITREQAAVLLSNLYDKLNINAEVNNNKKYSDDKSITDWAKNSVYKMSGLKIDGKNVPVFEGVGKNQFNPIGFYTRQESIATILRIYNMF